MTQRTLQPNNPFPRILGLTQADYDAAAPLIPEAVLAGSGEEDGWVFGIKEFASGRTGPRDPSLGGGFQSAIIMGFRAAR